MRPQPSKRRWETITFRPVGRVDFPLIASWLAEPHVARWWNQEFTIDAIERDFGPRVDGTEPGEDYLILVDKRPVGLIQHYQFADYPEYVEELAPVMAVPDHAVSIDYLIGSHAHRTRSGHRHALTLRRAPLADQPGGDLHHERTRSRCPARGLMFRA